MFMPQQVEGDRFLLRIVIRVAQEDAEPLLIGDIFDGSADQGKERVANSGYDQTNGMGWLGAQDARHQVRPIPSSVHHRPHTLAHLGGTCRP